MPSRVVLTNAMIITGTDAPPLVGAVVVENEVITDVIDGVPRRIGRSQFVDLAGQSLLPGLIDAHVHITAVDVDITNQHRHRFESEIAVLGARSLTEMLERGFTTVRDAGGADAGFRRVLEHGQLAGPRLLVSGRPLSQTGGHGDQRLASEYGAAQDDVPHVGLIHAIADGPEEVRRAARQELRRGADQVKLMASGGVMSPTDRLASVQYTIEELRAAVEAAQSVGTYVMAHAYTPEAISRCVAAGIHSIEHGNLLNEATAKLMADHNVFLVPTLVNVANYARGSSPRRGSRESEQARRRSRRRPAEPSPRIGRRRKNRLWFRPTRPPSALPR